MWVWSKVRMRAQRLDVKLAHQRAIQRELSNESRVIDRREAAIEDIASNDDPNLGVEHSVHDFFRNNNNYFPSIEEAAEEIASQISPDHGEYYVAFREYLRTNLGVEVKIVRDEVLGSSLRYFDRENQGSLLHSL